MRIPSASTDRYLYFVAVDSGDLKTRETGFSSFTVRRSRNGGASAAYTTPTINETDTSNMPGVYELLLDEDTTLDSGHDTEEYVVHITHAGMAPVTRVVELYRPKGTEGRTAAVDASGNASADLVLVDGATVDPAVAQLGVNVIQAAGTAWGSGAITSGVFAAGAITGTATASSFTDEIETATGVALAAIRLDELMAADSDINGVSPPTTGSVFFELMSKSAVAFTYDQTTDSLEALRDRGDAAWITATGFSTLNAADVTAAVWHSLVASNDNTIGSFGEQFAAQYQAVTVDIQTQITALNDLDAAGIRAAIGLASANLDTQLDALPTATEVRNAVTGGAYALDTDANGRVRIVDGTGVGEIDTNGGAIASVLALGATALASVNAEVVDCLNVDTYAQASQGTPPATASIAANVTMLAKFARNKRTQASGYVNIFNDDATTVDHKSAVSDDGTTFTAGEFATGP